MYSFPTSFRPNGSDDNRSGYQGGRGPSVHTTTDLGRLWVTDVHPYESGRGSVYGQNVVP